VLSRNTSKTLAKLEGGRLHWDRRAPHLEARPSDGRQPWEPRAPARDRGSRILLVMWQRYCQIRVRWQCKDSATDDTDLTPWRTKDTKDRAFTLEGEAVLSRNTSKTQAKLEGGGLGSTGIAGLRTCILGRQTTASPGNPERQLGTGEAVFCNLANYLPD